MFCDTDGTFWLLHATQNWKIQVSPFALQVPLLAMSTTCTLPHKTGCRWRVFPMLAHGTCAGGIASSTYNKCIFSVATVLCMRCICRSAGPIAWQLVQTAFLVRSLFRLQIASLSLLNSSSRSCSSQSTQRIRGLMASHCKQTNRKFRGPVLLQCSSFCWSYARIGKILLEHFPLDTTVITASTAALLLLVV